MPENTSDFSFRKLFIPFTTGKAISIIIIVGFLVFFNTLFNGFVGDDNGQIVYNNSIRSFVDVTAYFKGNFYSVGEYFNTVNYFRPFMYVAYTLILGIFGTNPFFFHFIVAALYIINAVLLFLFLRNFFLKEETAFILSLIFLVNPVNGEIAVYIANIQDSLFFLFGLIVLLMLVKKQVLSFSRLIGINLLLLASLLSKETGLVFLFLIPLFSFLFHRKELLKLIVVSTLVFLEYVFLRFGIAHFSLADSRVAIAPMIDFSLGERIINIPAIIFYYLKTFTFPLDLAIFQVWTVNQMNLVNFYIPLVVVVLFFIGIFFLGKRILMNHGREAFSIYIFFFLWFLGGLVPHIQLFPIDSTVADRWFYLSSVGLLVMVAFAYDEFIKIEKWRKISTMLFLLVIGLYSIRTIERNADWKDDITLTTHDVKINPDSYILVSTYGSILQANKDYEKAEPYLKKAVELNPDIVSYWMLLGTNEAKMKNKEEARKAFLKADSLAPQSSVAASMHSAILLSEGKYDEVTAYTQGVHARPSIIDPYSPMIIAVMEYNQGNKERAIELLTESVNIAPKLLAKDLYWKINRNQSIEDGYILEKFLEGY